jgi:hypothetical protein
VREDDVPVIFNEFNVDFSLFSAVKEVVACLFVCVVRAPIYLSLDVLW